MTDYPTDIMSAAKAVLTGLYCYDDYGAVSEMTADIRDIAAALAAAEENSQIPVDTTHNKR